MAAIDQDIQLKLQTKKALSQMDNFSRQAGSKLSVLKSGIAALGGIVVAAGIGAIFKSSITGASDLTEELGKGRAIFGSYAKNVEKFGNTAARQFGLSKQEALGMASSIGLLVKNMGKTEEESAEMGIRFSKLAVDMASFQNVPVSEALIALKAGLVNSSEPLLRFGVDTRNAAKLLKAQELGLKVVSGRLTEQQNLLVIQEIIMAKTKDQQGNFADTQFDMANAMKVMRAQLTNLSTSFGSIFLPIVTKGLGLFNDFLPKVQPFIDKFKTLINDNLTPIKNFGTGVKKSLMFVFEALKALFSPIIKTVFESLKTALKELADFFQPVIDFMVKHQGTILKTFKIIGIVVSGIFKLMVDVQKKFIGVIVNLLKNTFKSAKALFDFIMKFVVEPLEDGFKTMLENVTSFFKSAFTWIQENVIDPFLVGFRWIMAQVASIMGATFDFLTEKADGSKNALGELFDSAPVQAYKDIVVGNLKGIFKSFDGLFGEDGVGSTVNSFYANMKKQIGEVLNATLIANKEIKDSNVTTSEEGADADTEATDTKIDNLERMNEAITVFFETRLEKVSEFFENAESFTGIFSNFEEKHRKNKKKKEIKTIQDRAKRERAALDAKLKNGLIEKVDFDKRMKDIDERERLQTENKKAELSKRSAIEKANAIFTGLSNTFSAAIAAFKALAGIPVVGPALGAAAAAAATAMGLRNVAQIKSVELLAKGGLITQPTFAIAGEAGPEVFAPKDDFIGFANSLIKNAGLDFGGGSQASNELIERLKIQEVQQDAMLNEMVGIQDAILNLKLTINNREIALAGEAGQLELT